MTPKELEQYRDMKKEIKHLENEIEKLDGVLCSPRIAILTDMPKSPSPASDAMADNVVKLVELKNKYIDMLNDLYKKQAEIEDAIADLEPRERELIRYRYFDGLKWKDIFPKIEYQQRQTFRIRKEILTKLENERPEHMINEAND